MAPFLFPYPTTGSVTFANVLLDRSGAYTLELADATVARTKLQLALKAAATGEQGSSALQVLEVSSGTLQSDIRPCKYTSRTCGASLRASTPMTCCSKPPTRVRLLQGI